MPKSVFGGEAEGFEQGGSGGGSAVVVDAEGFAVQADVPVPGHRAAGFHGNAGADFGGQDGFFVFGALLLKQLHAGHRDDAGIHAFFGQQVFGLHHLLDLAAGGDQQDIRHGLFAVGQNVAALHGLAAALFVLGQVLAGQHQGGGQAVGQGGQPAGGGLLAVRGTEDQQVGRRPQTGQLPNCGPNTGIMSAAYLNCFPQALQR